MTALERNEFLFFDETTWPAGVRDYLGKNAATFLQAEEHDAEVMKQYLAPGNQTPMALMPTNPFFKKREALSLSLDKMLLPYSLRGWHCTRLTRDEMELIKANGMSLPGPELLAERLASLVTTGQIRASDASLLLSRNQADDAYRSDRIWFCFFHPKHAGEDGIGRFFRHWGGEALYNSHEDDPKISPVLRGIGIPCVVEATVPIASLPQSYGAMGERLFRRFLANNHSIESREEVDFESCSLEPVPKESIVRIVDYPSSDFFTLTDCRAWSQEYAVK